LRARAISLETNEVIGADETFDLLNAARVAGDDWPAARDRLASEPMDDLIDRCGDVLGDDFESATHDRKLDNEDRVNFQIKAAQRHRDRQVAIQQRLLDTYREQGRTKMIPLIEGKIRKLNERFED